MAIHEVLYASVRSYGKRVLQDADFTGDFMTYLNRALQNKQPYEQEKFFKPEHLEDAIGYVVNSLLEGYTSQKVVGYKAEPNILQGISTILKAKKDPDVFGHLQKSTKDRILTAEKKEDYWQKQAKRIRNELITKKNAGEEK